MTGPRSVLIVDPDAIFRLGLEELIRREEDFCVCGSFGDPAEATASEVVDHAEIAVTGLAFRDGQGLDAVRALSSRIPEVPVLVLSSFDETYYADRALRAGAMGYVMKGTPPEQILGALRTMLSGRRYLSDRMVSRVLEGIAGQRPGQSSSPVDRLSDREIQILELLGQGLGTRDIAATLHLSVKTIENYREHVKAKLSLRNSTELIRYAIIWVLERQRARA